MRAVTQWLKSNDYGCVDDSYYSYIALWARWYAGKVPSVHNYQQYNGREKISRTRKTLGIAKMVAEDWANLALNEKVQISVSDRDGQDESADGKSVLQQKIDDVLLQNNFRVRGNQLVELTFALGTGAIVEYLDGDNIKLDYIRGGMIYPLRWDNGKIIDCAFASERTTGKEKQVYLNIHKKTDSGQYVIENHLFRRNGNMLTPLDLPEGVEPVVNTGMDVPCFQILKPNIVNNVDPDCPLGISVFANSLDQLEGADLVYDSYCNEFRLGKKRITIPMSMARFQLEDTGAVTPIFDANDTEFYAVPSQDGENKIQEHNMDLRYEAHEAGLQTALNLISWKCGFGVKRYNFQDGQVKTATEVISDKSDLFQNLKKHELLLNDALSGMIRAIAVLLGVKSEISVKIDFDDSIIEDSDAERERDRRDVNDGFMQPWEYRSKWYGEDEATAKAAVSQSGGLFGDEE